MLRFIQRQTNSSDLARSLRLYPEEFGFHNAGGLARQMVAIHCADEDARALDFGQACTVLVQHQVALGPVLGLAGARRTAFRDTYVGAA
jgi:hypothetical protein